MRHVCSGDDCSELTRVWDTEVDGVRASRPADVEAWRACESETLALLKLRNEGGRRKDSAGRRERTAVYNEGSFSAGGALVPENVLERDRGDKGWGISGTSDSDCIVALDFGSSMRFNSLTDPDERIVAERLLRFSCFSFVASVSPLISRG